MKIELNVLGFINSSFSLKNNTSLNKYTSKIKIEPDYLKRLKDFKNFTHLTIIYYLEENSSLEITSVELINISENILTVRGLNKLALAKILDIKPYHKRFETKEKSKAPEWIDRINRYYF